VPNQKELEVPTNCSTSSRTSSVQTQPNLESLITTRSQEPPPVTLTISTKEEMLLFHVFKQPGSPQASPVSQKAMRPFAHLQANFQLGDRAPQGQQDVANGGAASSQLCPNVPFTPSLCPGPFGAFEQKTRITRVTRGESTVPQGERTNPLLHEFPRNEQKIEWFLERARCGGKGGRALSFGQRSLC